MFPLGLQKNTSISHSNVSASYTPQHQPILDEPKISTKPDFTTNTGSTIMQSTNIISKLNRAGYTDWDIYWLEYFRSSSEFPISDTTSVSLQEKQSYEDLVGFSDW